MKPTFFNISHFCIADGAIPKEVADKIYTHHLLPLDEVRHKFGYKIYISKNSGYRPFKWEKNRGRSGDSEHVFRGFGAVDVRAEDIKELITVLKYHSDYNRIAYYPFHGFIHLDYGSEDGRRHYFEADQHKNWKWKEEIKFE